jgi:hypothetical protein
MVLKEKNDTMHGSMIHIEYKGKERGGEALLFRFSRLEKKKKN